MAKPIAMRRRSRPGDSPAIFKSSGLGGADGGGSGSGVLLAGSPEQEEEHARDHDRRLPENGVCGGKESGAVVPDPEKSHDPHEVQQLDRREPEQKPRDPRAPGGGKSEHRGTEEKG